MKSNARAVAFEMTAGTRSSEVFRTRRQAAISDHTDSAAGDNDRSRRRTSSTVRSTRGTSGNATSDESAGNGSASHGSTLTPTPASTSPNTVAE